MAVEVLGVVEAVGGHGLGAERSKILDYAGSKTSILTHISLTPNLPLKEARFIILNYFQRDSQSRSPKPSG